jgi:hypothetical protein
LWLLPERKAEQPASYQLAQLFVARCFTQLNGPVTTLINQVGGWVGAWCLCWGCVTH